MVVSEQVYDQVVAFIEAGLQRPPSRNLHFEDWKDPVRGQAYRVFARLKRLSRDVEGQLRAQRRVDVVPGEDPDVLQLRYSLDNPRGVIRRTAQLSSSEWTLLLRLCPELGERTRSFGSWA